MDREGFRNRLKQYKKAREENPGLKYWEWKDIPKYAEGINDVTLKEKEDAFWRGDTQKMAELVEREGKQLTYVTPQSNIDEVVITANKPKQNQYSELDFAKDVAGFVPVLGDAVDIYDVGKSLYNGNYSQAALLGAGLLLPNWLEKGGKYLYKGIRNNWRRFKRNLHMHPSYNNQYMLGEHINSVASRVADNEVRRSGIEEYIDTYVPLFNENDIKRIRTSYVNAQQRNAQSAEEAIKAVQVHNIGKFTPTQLREINETFKEDPRYADFILSHPELNPLDAETVDRFITKQNSFIRGVHSNEDNDLLISQMLTENPSDVSKKTGGDRLGTDSRGIYVSNSGEIADRFQRSIGSSVRSDIGFLQKTPATDIDTPIRERLAAERRRIFPFDLVPNASSLSSKDLIDLGYVAKESQYTTRFGNKLPGYERAYVSNTLDVPTLTIRDLQTVKGNLEDKKGRWGIGGVQSVPELEDQLFDGLNIGTSYGDFLHLMRALKQPNLAAHHRQYNLDFGNQVHKRQRELNNLFGKQVDKQVEIKNKILKNPYLNAAQNVHLNSGPIFGISGTLGITGASVYGIMNSPDARQRDRFQNAMEDDEFAEWFRNSLISPDDYSSTTSYVDAIMKEWNKQNPNKSFAEGGEVGDNDFMRQFGKQVSYKPEETSWWSNVKNWWNDLTGMKNYAYGNCATTPNGKHTKECAHYSNSVLRNRGYKNIVGDAWTRAANSGMKKITSGYDGLTKPAEWDESDAHDYLQSAANNFINNVDTTALNPYDVIGLYYPDSPNTKKAFEQGRWGETQTHTGHIAVGNDGTHYVVHNVGGHLKMNKLADMLTGDYDYLPVSAYRPKK